MSQGSSRRRRHEPEVVVFEEPKHDVKPKRGKQTARERHAFLAGNVNEIFSDCPGEQRNQESAGQRDGSDTLGRQSNDELDIKATLREVEALAASSLVGKQRRKFEYEQVVALGAKPPKKQRMPYPLYQTLMKGRQENEVGSRKRSVQKKFRGKGRWKDKTKGLEMPVGKFKSGVLQLTQKDITKINRTRT